MATRRLFLAGLGAALLPSPSWADTGSPAFLAAGKVGDGFLLYGLTAKGSETFRLPLPARGHAATAHPIRPQAVAFARRPGTYALVIDCASGVQIARLTPPEGRQFNGHGAFLQEGAVLATSEVVAETSEGRIGLWDTATFRRRGDWPSHGIGPHEIKALSDGRLLVANGGIRTDPQDRTKLNLATMRPNLTLLSADGAALDQWDLPDWPQLSIRHIAPTGTGAALALQWEGDPAETPPVLALWSESAGLTLAPDAPEWAALQGYAGSIAASADRIALTSAPGGAVLLCDARGQPETLHRRTDISGIAVADGDFVATDGGGAVWSVAQDLRLLSRDGPLWDNHLVTLTA